MKSKPSYLVVYDSGIGGRSIVASLIDTFPAINLLYACDNKNFPYGSKSEEAVTQFVLENMETLAKSYSISGLVVACNTASTVALPALRERFSFPIIGVVPAIKPAAALSKTKVIGLLATPGTIARKYTSDLIRQFAPNCKVVKVGSSKLVELAERKTKGETIRLEEVSRELIPLINEKSIDTIVLGCTHFPAILAELRQCFPGEVQWLDSAEAITKRVAEILPEVAKGSSLRQDFFTE